jgi:predicted type IV restriction endonuclease
MSFEKIKAVSEQVLNRIPSVRGKGEQATKQSLVLPILDALGYDIWNPAEVCPEYEADFAIKKAGQKEKVDIAIFIQGIPRIYFEVKPLDFVLDGHEGQLARYFNATASVTLGILTNGLEWRFFTDTGNPNVMDAQPFHIVKLDAADQGLDVLARFAKQVFSAEAIRDYATELRYTAQIASFLRRELDLKDKEPSEYFLRWILKADQMYEGVVNANVLDRFRPIAKDALTRVVREIVRRSISAMEKEAAQPVKKAPDQKGTTSSSEPESAQIEIDNPSAIDAEISGSSQSKIATTEKELAVFGIVKDMFERSLFAGLRVRDAATRKEVSLDLTYKDTTGYFGIFFNKPSWWVIRLYIEGRRNWIGLNVDEAVGSPLIPEGMTRLEPHPFSAFRVQIDKPEDVVKLEKLLLAAFEKTIKDRAKAESEDAGK